MSQENVDIAREAVEAMNRRDTDAFVARLHPGVVWEETVDAFSGLKGNYRGPREVRRWAEQAVVELWSELKMEIEEITEMSDGGVLLGTRISARGTASGVDTETHAWQIFWFADERISRRQGPFWARDEALEAAGLSE
ncbi:MAG TPA: nuclear transport factor 2 family protein [Solirubrobacterales bacterium]